MKTKLGFTLLELLVVVLIIGVLAGIALPQYKKAVLKSRATEAIMTLKSISDAQKRYLLLNNSCAADLTNLDVEIKNGFYNFHCLSSCYCYARPRNGSRPAFEISGSGNTLYCRGTAEECRIFSTTQVNSAGSDYWLIHK